MYPLHCSTAPSCAVLHFMVRSDPDLLMSIIPCWQTGVGLRSLSKLKKRLPLRVTVLRKMIGRPLPVGLEAQLSRQRVLDWTTPTSFPGGQPWSHWKHETGAFCSHKDFLPFYWGFAKPGTVCRPDY